jgi:methylglutaconyl-CoA hydratase
MSSSLVLKAELEPSIVLLTLNRPVKCNALNIALLTQLLEYLNHLQQDLSTRVLILQGAGPLFCTGLDLEEALDPSQAEEVFQLLAKTFTLLIHLPCIAIAAIQGAAYAGGFGLVAACDLAIAAEDTQIRFPEVQRGLVPALVASLMYRHIPLRPLRQLLYLGESIGAKQAQSLGLIDEVTVSADLLPTALMRARQVLKGAPNAIRETKHLLKELSFADWEQNLQLALSFHQQARQSPEMEEGLRAFREKREPSWIKTSLGSDAFPTPGIGREE